MTDTKTVEPGRCEDYIDPYGNLCVPMTCYFDKAPIRPGWKPFFVQVKLEPPVVKIYKYKRTDAESQSVDKESEDYLRKK